MKFQFATVLAIAVVASAAHAGEPLVLADKDLDKVTAGQPDFSTSGGLITAVRAPGEANAAVAFERIFGEVIFLTPELVEGVLFVPGFGSVTALATPASE